MKSFRPKKFKFKGCFDLPMAPIFNLCYRIKSYRIKKTMKIPAVQVSWFKVHISWVDHKIDKISPLDLKGRLFQILWSSLKTWTLTEVWKQSWFIYSRFGLGYCSSCRSRSFEQAVIEKGQKFPKKVKCGSKCLAKAHWFNFFLSHTYLLTGSRIRSWPSWPTGRSVGFLQKGIHNRLKIFLEVDFFFHTHAF